MKRVGIITLFHGSLNYGGVLQAYALCKVLDQLGISGEQIRCIYEEETEQRTMVQALKKMLNPRIVWNRLCYELNSMRSRQRTTGRREAFNQFTRKFIPSSDRVYTTANIQECVGDYDAFITGSDQVWNPEWYSRTLFLDFVPDDIPKISYAASLGQSVLTESQQEKFRRHLYGFKAVSVREADAAKLLSSLSPVPVQCTLDPTLLLSKEQWDAVCADRLTEERYIFCYFLGGDEGRSEIVEQYAREGNYKIAGIPYILSDFHKKSRISYELKFPDASPAEFLSLIKHAAVIFTDSFHVVAFSGIFQKECFAFPRVTYSDMSSRIYQVSTIFNSENHFCDTDEKCSLSYINQVSPIPYEKQSELLVKSRTESIAFLKTNLEQ